ncbi:MAG: peptidyl-prolyl cis-trans isomerase [Planctomycetes bacterium]|nr:peptidyl-prolyl cis-trans isomerase [Planctomycetota bacterium]
MSWAAGEEKRMTLDLDNESVARVGIEALSKREIESRMLNASAEMVRLFALRDRLKADGAWTPEHAAQFDERYLPAFNEELRNAIRERLMLQQAKRERLELDRAAFARRLEGVLELYRKHKLLFTPGNSVEEIRKRLRAEMLVETFRASLMDFLDAPRRPEIERYYREHPEEFRRGTGYSVRRIRVDCVRTGLDGREVVDPGAPKRAEELHAEAARDPSCFKELAAKHSDDPEDVRKKGGLLEGSDGDPFLELDDSEAPLARALRGLKPPDGLSPVFEMGRGSFAFVLLIDVRAAGIRPLDASLLEKIGKDLLQEKIRLKEEAWFHKALAENLVQRIEGGRETNFRDAFLFPDAAPTRRPADPARTRGEANP